MKEPKSTKDLRWVRIFDPIHIPKYLVEQIRDREFEIEDFYDYQANSCVDITDGKFEINPFNHLYILVDKENITKGFVWMIIDPLSKNIFINNYSVDKEYWNKDAVDNLAYFVKDLRRKADLKKIFWITNFPKHSERHGFKRSKSILMEYTEEKDAVIHRPAVGGDETQKYQSTESRTATALQERSVA